MYSGVTKLIDSFGIYIRGHDLSVILFLFSVSFSINKIQPDVNILSNSNLQKAHGYTKNIATDMQCYSFDFNYLILHYHY